MSEETRILYDKQASYVLEFSQINDQAERKSVYQFLDALRIQISRFPLTDFKGCEGLMKVKWFSNKSSKTVETEALQKKKKEKKKKTNESS